MLDILPQIRRELSLIEAFPETLTSLCYEGNDFERVKCSILINKVKNECECYGMDKNLILKKMKKSLFFSFLAIFGFEEKIDIFIEMLMRNVNNCSP